VTKCITYHSQRATVVTEQKRTVLQVHVDDCARCTARCFIMVLITFALCFLRPVFDSWHTDQLCMFTFSWFFSVHRDILKNGTLIWASWGSSVSTVSDYGLDDRGSIPEAEDFSSSLCVQTGSGAHTASCTMGTGGSLPGGKARPGRDADHSPLLVSRLRKHRSYTSCHPNAPLWSVTGPL
jgi:hypothetical protein